MNDNCILFAGNSSQKLGQLIAHTDFGIRLGKIEHTQFPSGEWYCELQENVRGADVFLINSISKPANDSLCQLGIMADACRRSSAGRLTAVIPYYGYARQDRKDRPRVPISAKWVLDVLEASGFDRVVTMDMHAPQIAGFTNLPFDHLQFRPVLLDTVKTLRIEVVVAPDVGAVKRSEEYANKLKVDMAIISKKRKDATTVKATQFIGDVKGKRVLIVDDLTESVGTLVEASENCKDNGAVWVSAAVTHGCFTDIGRERLVNALEKKIIDKFFYSNTVDALDLSKEIPSTLHPQLTELDVAPLFGKAIYSIHNNESISSLFV
jgi:ribose-phosphate pyrophosphokinase